MGGVGCVVTVIGSECFTNMLTLLTGLVPQIDVDSSDDESGSDIAGWGELYCI